MLQSPFASTRLTPLPRRPASRLLLLLFTLFLSSACASTTAQTPSTFAQPTDLVGRTLEIDYGSARYQVHIQSAERIHWECIEGEERGAQAEEKALIQASGDGLFHVNWVEGTGLGVSQLLDTRESRVHTVLRDGTDLIPLSGSVIIR